MSQPGAESVVVERLHPGDEARLRAIRLRALKDAPHAFDTTLEEARRWPADRWQQQLRILATFVAVLGGRDDVGLVRVGPGDDDPSAAYLVSLWVAPALRRRRVGTELIRAAARWAEASRFKTLRLDVADTNRAAIGLYECAGFHPTGRTGTLPPPRDHVREIEMAISVTPPPPGPS